MSLSAGGITRLAYTENSGPVPVDGLITITATAGLLLTHASVQIAYGFDRAQDSLSLPSFAASLGITGTYDAATGLLSLIGSASAADYQAVLRGVRYENNSDAPSIATRKVVFAIGDGTRSQHVGVDVKLVPIDDAPVVATSGLLQYSAGHANVIDPSLTVRDVDSAQLKSAQVSISGGYHAGQDVLAVAPGFRAGLSIRFDTATGTLTLSGRASPQTYEDVLRHVTYTNTAATPSDLSTGRTISFVVNDGTLPSQAQTVHVGFANHPPVLLISGGAVYSEHAAPTAIAPGALVSDVDSADFGGGSLTVSVSGLATAADQLTIIDQGTAAGQVGVQGNLVTYGGVAIGTFSGGMNGADLVITLSAAATPAAVQALTRDIAFSCDVVATPGDPRTATFTLKDGDGGTDTATAATTISIALVNDPPQLLNGGGPVPDCVEGAGAVPVLSTVIAFDPEFTLTRATVRVFDNFQNGDTLSFTDTAHIHGSYDAASGVLTLTGTASSDEYQAALRSVVFGTTADNPAPLKSILAIVNDGHSDSEYVTYYVTVTNTNDPPSLALGSSLSYTENEPQAAIAPTATVFDPDGSPDFDGGSLTVSITANATASDQLSIIDSGWFAGVIGLNGNTVTYGGYSIGTFSGGANGTDLVIEFGPYAGYYPWSEAVQALTRAIAFDNASDDPSTLPRTLSFTLVDGDGGTDTTTATTTVGITAIPDVPLLAASGAGAACSEGGAPVVVDSGFTIQDVDGTPLQGATVRISGNFRSGDTLAFTDTARITGHYDAATGLLTLTGTATAADYEAALRSVTFAATGDESPSSRTIDFVASIGSAESNHAGSDITVAPTNDAPVLALGPALAYTENDVALIAPNATLTDIDSADFGGGTLTVSITANAASDDQLSIQSTPGALGRILAFNNVVIYNGLAFGTYSGGENGSDLVIHVTRGDVGTQAVVQELIRSITFANTSDNPSALPRTLSFTLTESDGVAGQAATTVDVHPVNDAPVLGGTASAQYVDGGAPVALAPGITVSDAESDAITGATLSFYGNFQAGDTLDFTDTANIAGQYDAAAGRLTLTGTASLAQYQDALQSIAFYTSNPNPSPTKGVSIVVSDGSSTSGAATVGIAIATPNHPPALSLGTPSSYIEQSAPVVLFPNAMESDPDFQPFQTGYMLVKSTDYDDELAIQGYSSNSWLSGGWISTPDGLVRIQSGHGTTPGWLQVSFSNYSADIQDFLRAITFFNASDNPAGTRTLQVELHDRSGAVTTASTGFTVLPVNDPPTLAGGGGSFAFVEGGAATVIGTGITIADPDDRSLESATVAITNFHAGDRLVFSSNFGITGTYDATRSVLKFTGSADLWLYERVLHDVAFATDSDDPGTSRTVTFAVNDGDAASNFLTSEIAITPVNDAPSLTMPGIVNFGGLSPGVAVISGASVTDRDSADFDGGSLTVGIAAGGTATDVLSIQDQGTGAGQIGISGGVVTYGGVAIGTFTGGAGGADLVVTFDSAAATPAAVEALTRAITLADTSGDPFMDPRTLTFTVVDGDGTAVGGQDTASREVTVNPLALVLSTHASSWTEGDSPATIDPLLEVFASDGGLLFSSVTVQITGGFQAGHDTLAFQHDGLPIVGAYDATLGVLTLSQQATALTADQWRVLLQGVTFSTDSHSPGTSRDITFSAGLTTATKTLAVTDVDFVPVLAVSGGSASYVENASPAAVDPALTVTHAESSTLAGATVKITGGFEAAQDVLAFTPVGGITASYDAATGVLTLSGTATLAEYQQALRSVSYSNTSDDPSTAVRTLEFQANDGDGLLTRSAPVTRTVTVSAVNDAPVVGGTGSLSLTENDAAVLIAPGATIADPDSTDFNGGSLTVSFLANGDASDQWAIVAQGTGPGDIGLSGNSVTYGGAVIGTFSGGSNGADLVVGFTSSAATPEAVQALTRAISFANTSDDPATLRTATLTVTDGDGGTGTASTTISVTPVNDAPILTASSGSAAWTEGTSAIAADPAIALFDADNADMAGGRVAITGNFQPGDALVFTNTAQIAGSYDAATGVLTLTGSATLAQYQAALRSVAFQSSNDDPTTGKTLSFTVNDGSADSDVMTREIAVTAVNDAPQLAVGTTLSFTENDGPAALASTAIVSDPDSADFDGGTLTVGFSSNGTTADQLAIENQGSGAGQIGVSGSDVTYAGTTIASFSGGADGAALVISFTGADATAAAVQALTRAITFTNTSDDPSTLPRSVTFTVTDGDGGSRSAGATVHVAAVDDAPVVIASGGTASWTEGAGAAVVDAGIALSDVDNANLAGARVSISGNFESGDTLVFTDTAQISGSYDAATGVLTLTGAATVAQYQAALESIAFQTGNEHPAAVKTISFVVDDGSADSTATTRDITLTPVNDPPVLAVGTSTIYGERQTNIFIAPAAQLSDVDSADFNGGSLTVAFAAHGAAADRIAIIDQGTDAGRIGVTGSNVTYGGTSIGTFSGGDSGSGLVITFTSAAATQAAVQELVRDIAYTETSGTLGSTPLRDVSFTLVDGDGGTDRASADASLQLVAAPVLTASAATPLAYTENAGPMAIDGGLAVTDLDSPDLQGASVTISSNYANGQDVLAFTSVGNITGSFDRATGVLTLSGSDTLAHYQAALQSVTYENTSEDPSTLTRTISFHVQDEQTAAPGHGVTRDIVVTAVNDAPVNTVPADAAIGTAFSNTAFAVTGVSIADVDAQGTNLQTHVTVTNGSATFDLSGGAIVSAGANGSGDVTLQGTFAQVKQALATLSFKSTDGFTGTATVAVATSDPASAGTDTDTFHIGVVPQVFVIDNTAGTSVATFNALGTSGAGDYIYVMYGTGTYTAADGFNLQANQHLYGQGQTLQFTNPVTGAVVTVGTGASGTAPTISVTGAGSHAVDLATGNEIKGINFATTASSQTAISDSGSAVGSLTISDVDVTGSGQAVNITNGGSLNLAFDTLSSSGGAYGVKLGGAMTGSFTARSGTLSGHSGSEFDINGGAATITYAGALGNGSGSSVTVANLTGGAVTFSGNITDSSDAGGGISVTGSAGTVTFSGTSKTLNTGAGAGVTLTGNTGTVNFANGGLNITTASGTGFNDTAGTLNVTGTGNIISTGTGTALNVSNATIGASDLTFQSISSNGAASGIVLNNTGSSGGLNVTGTGTTPGSGGTIQASTGSGISLTSTRDVSLNNVVVKTSADSGIVGTAVTNFSLDGSSIVNNGNGVSDDGIQLYSATGNAVAGTVSITDSDVSGNAQYNVHLGNAAGTIGSLVVSNSTFAGVNPTWGAGLFRVDESGSAAIGSATMNLDTFSGNAGLTGLAVAAGGTATVSNFTVTGGTFSNTGSDLSFSQSGSANLDFNLRSSSMTLATSDAVVVSSDSASTGGSITGEISSNRIGTTGVGSSVGSGIEISLQGRTAGTLQISSNTIGSVAIDGIDAQFQTTSGTTHNLTITNNTIGANDDVAGFAIYAAVKGTGVQTVKANITGNTLPFDNLLYQNADASGTAQLFDTPPTSTTAAAQLQSANFGNTAGFSTVGTVTLFTGGVSLPPILVAPGEAPPPASGAAPVTQLELQTTLDAAIVRWEHAGLSLAQDSLLHLATITAMPTGNGELAAAEGTTLFVDPDADGYGWFVDATPLDDSEFAEPAGGPQAGHMDLLTAVMHELGHVLGLADRYDPADSSALMYGYLELGERRLPEVTVVGLASSSSGDT